MLVFFNVIILFISNAKAEAGLFCFSKDKWPINVNITSDNETFMNKTYSCNEICKDYDDDLLKANNKIYNSSFKLYFTIAGILNFYFMFKKSKIFFSFYMLGQIGIYFLDLFDWSSTDYFLRGSYDKSYLIHSIAFNFSRQDANEETC